MNKKAFLLVNLGTPDNPSPSEVGKYLKQFLNDPKVIDIPQPWRWILVNFIIIPFRKHRSAKLYSSVWTDRGSPLLLNMQSFTDKLRLQIRKEKPDLLVDFAMRYGRPSIEEKMKILSKKASEITVIPLYPQYATSTSESTFEEVFRVLKKFNARPTITTHSFFFNQNFYLQAKSFLIKKYAPQSYDAVVFSYHGLPNRQLIKCSKEKNYQCLSPGCCSIWNEKNEYCYKAQCYQTTKLLSRYCNLDASKCITSFQSRLSNNWIEPFTDVILKSLPQKGKKKVLVVSPAFVSDCLETIHELGVEYREVFLKSGGEVYEWVKALNDEDVWIREFSNFLLKDISGE